MAPVLVFMLALSTYLVLYVFRAIDDNRLTSWQWVFGMVDLKDVLWPLVIGLVAAYLFSRMALSPRYYGAFLFIASFALAVLFWRVPEVIIDTSRYFTQAKHLGVFGTSYFIAEWGRSIVPWTDLPLIPFLYGVIFKFFGESRLYIQIFTTLLFSATVVLTYQIGKTLWDEQVGFLGGLLLLSIPYLFTQVPLMLVDVPTMFFFTLAIYAFIKALRRGGTGMIILAAVAVFGAVFSKYSTWLMLSILPVIFLVHLYPFQWRQQRLIVGRGILVALLAAVLIGVVVYLKFDVLAEQIRLLISYQQPGLKRWGESFYSTFLFQTHPLLPTAALYSGYVALKKKDLKYLIISWLILLIFVLHIERIRYIIMVFPMLALMAAYGLQAIKNQDLQKHIVFSAVVSSVVIAVFAFLPFLQQMSAVNLQQAGEYLNNAAVERIDVYTLPFKDFDEINPAVSVPLLDLFTRQEIAYDYKHTAPPLERIVNSSLRFTWDYLNPEYYTSGANRLKEDIGLVIIAQEPVETLPEELEQEYEGYRLARTFATSTGIFRYQTVVTIYRLEDGR